MNEDLAVLYRLGKALRCHDAAQFMRHYDALVEQEGLSDYTVRTYVTYAVCRAVFSREVFCLLPQLMNHKEAVRQISELDEEDFSLLECAVATADKPSLRPPHKKREGQNNEEGVRVHVLGLREEEAEEMSITEQLQCLLERLRMDGKGRVSTDSGTMSDLDSLPGAVVEEEKEDTRQPERGDRQPERGNRQPERGNRQPERGDRQPERGDRQPERGDKHISSHPLHSEPSASISEGTKSGDKSFERERESSVGVRGDAGKVTSTRQQKQLHVSSGVKKRGKERGHRSLDESSIQRRLPANISLPAADSRRVVEKTNKIPRAELIEHTRHKHDTSEVMLRQTARQTFQEQERTLSTESKGAEEDSGGSPTEGGPFITHWGKGRWRRNSGRGGGGGGGRDQSRRQFNTVQQFTDHPRQQFLDPYHRQRYSRTDRDRSPRYSARAEPHNRETMAQGGYRRTMGVRQRGGGGGGEAMASRGPGSSRPGEKRERYRSPPPPTQQQREDQSTAAVSSGETAVSRVASSGQSVPVASTGLSVPVASSGQSVPVASSGQSVPVASSGQSMPVAEHRAQPEKKQQVKLSYASVTGSSKAKPLPPLSSPSHPENGNLQASKTPSEGAAQIDQNTPANKSRITHNNMSTPAPPDNAVLTTTTTESLQDKVRDRSTVAQTGSIEKSTTAALESTDSLDQSTTTGPLVDEVRGKSSLSLPDKGTSRDSINPAPPEMVAPAVKVTQAHADHSSEAPPLIHIDQISPAIANDAKATNDGMNSECLYRVIAATFNYGETVDFLNEGEIDKHTHTKLMRFVL